MDHHDLRTLVILEGPISVREVERRAVSARARSVNVKCRKYVRRKYVQDTEEQEATISGTCCLPSTPRARSLEY